MTDFTTAQLATILSALDGRRRKPASTEAALKAIARIAAALGRSTEAVLAAAPSLLDGRLDAAAWRDQLTARVEASKGKRIGAGLRLASPELPEYLVVRRRQLVPTSELGEPHGHCRRLLTAGYLPTASDH